MAERTQSTRDPNNQLVPVSVPGALSAGAAGGAGVPDRPVEPVEPVEPVPPVAAVPPVEPVAAVAGRTGLLRHRDFRLLFVGETTSGTGNAVTFVAMPLVAVTVLHTSTFVVGALAAATWLPWLVLGLPAGAWVDRWPRRPIMMACDLVSVLALASVPVAYWSGVLTVAQLLAVSLLAGSANVFFSTAYSAYLPSLVPAKDLIQGNALLQGSEAAGVVAGPGLGGLLAQLFGVVTGLLADAVSFAVSAACLLAIRGREPRQARTDQRRSTLREEVGDGMRFVLRDPYLRVLAYYGGTFNLIFNGVQALQIVFLVRIVGLEPGAVGLLFTVSAVGGVAGALLAPRLARRIGTARATLLLVLGTPPFGLLVLLATYGGPGLAVAVLGSMVLSGGTVADNIILGSFRQAYVPGDLLGRVLGSMRFVMHGTIPLGALLGGALGTLFGVRAAMGGLLLAGALVGLLLLASPIRRTRHLPTAPTPAPN